MQNVMSALPPIADMYGAKRDVRFVPEADIPTALSSSRWQVTIDLITEALITIADEDNTVPGRIAPVPFDLNIGKGKKPCKLMPCQRK